MVAPPPEDPPEGYFTGSPNEVLNHVLECIDTGEHDRAELIIAQLISNFSANAEAWNLRGINSLKGGNPELAIRCFAEASKLDLSSAVYASNLGNALGVDNRWEEAAGAWSRAVLLAPSVSAYQLGLATSLLHNDQIEDALEHGENALKKELPAANSIFTFAKALFDTKQTEAAINAYELGLTREPNNIEGQYQLALLLQTIGDQKGAIERYRSLLKANPDHAEALCNLSAAARDTGALDEAIRYGERALTLRPKFADAHNNLGLALCAAGKIDKAIDHFKTALKIAGQRYEILNNLGVAQQACGNFKAAESTLQQALNLEEPDIARPAAERNLGNVLRQMQRFDEAIIYYRIALEKSPLDFATYGNLGLTLLNLNKPDDAISVYEKALSLNPDHAQLRKSLGIAQLLNGAFEEGWHNYEARLEAHQSKNSSKRWDGQTRAKSLLVQAEQGFGDTIQFCRYIPSLYNCADKIIFECQPALKDLMNSLDKNIVIRSPKDPIVEADYHIPLLSLPMINDTKLETIPSAVPYLRSDQDLAQIWQNKFDEQRPKVGLVWSGNSKRQDDWMRSCPAEFLHSILDVEGCHFVSLQKEGVPQSLAPLHDLSSELTDFSQTAAAIMALDLVITVDTAVAHLAGALGKPVWVMLGYTADWRYLLKREDSPWYPTMRLRRQTKPGDWDGLTIKLASELKKWILVECPQGEI